MRVFLDTNVLISAFAARGLCADLLRVVLAEHQFVTGEVVLAELRAVLKKKLKMPDARVREIESFLREHEVVQRPRRHLSLGISDRDDEWIVASTVTAAADCLVSGDPVLLSLQDSPIPILSPRAFWDRLRDSGP